MQWSGLILYKLSSFVLDHCNCQIAQYKSVCGHRKNLKVVLKNTDKKVNRCETVKPSGLLANHDVEYN